MNDFEQDSPRDSKVDLLPQDLPAHSPDPLRWHRSRMSTRRRGPRHGGRCIRQSLHELRPRSWLGIYAEPRIRTFSEVSATRHHVRAALVVGCRHAYAAAALS